MFQKLFPRSRILKLIAFTVVFLLLSLLLFISDSIVSKIQSHRIPSSCILCPYIENVSFNNSTEVINFSVHSSKYSSEETVNIVSVFSHVNHNPSFKSKFILCLTSLFKHATPPLHLHIFTDDLSLKVTIEILQKTVPLSNTSIEVITFFVFIFSITNDSIRKIFIVF